MTFSAPSCVGTFAQAYNCAATETEWAGVPSLSELPLSASLLRHSSRMGDC